MSIAYKKLYEVNLNDINGTYVIVEEKLLIGACNANKSVMGFLT